MAQFEEANAGIAIAMARLDDEEMPHFTSQKSAKFKRIGYKLDCDKKKKRNLSEFVWRLRIMLTG